MTRLTLTIPGRAPDRPTRDVEWWTANDRLFWRDRARRTAAIRARATAAAIVAIHRSGAQPVTRAAITATVCTPTARRFDPHNIASTVLKAAIDGLVDAGLLPDDDATHLTAVTIQRGTPTGERGTYRLVLDVTEEQS